MEIQNPVEEPTHNQDKVSTTDPDSTYATKGGTPARMGYYSNYLIDNESCILAGVQATGARLSEESRAAEDMIARFTQWQGRKPESIAADASYGNGEFLQRLMDWVIGLVIFGPIEMLVFDQNLTQKRWRIRMKKKRFSVEQLVGILNQAKVGVPVAEVIRKAGISEQTFYRWEAKYAELEVDQVRQMAQLQEEIMRLKRLVADLMLDKTMLQDVLSKKMVKPSRREPTVVRLMSSYGASERHACRVLCVTRGTYRYRSCLDPRTELRMRIREIAQTRVRYGYRKIRVLLNREGWDVGKYLVYRLCKEEGLMLKRMKPAGKRKAACLREEKIKPTAPDEAWSMDFVSDQLQDGTRFRSLTIVDVYTREGGGG